MIIFVGSDPTENILQNLNNICGVRPLRAQAESRGLGGIARLAEAEADHVHHAQEAARKKYHRIAALLGQRVQKPGHDDAEDQVRARDDRVPRRAPAPARLSPRSIQTPCEQQDDTVNSSSIVHSGSPAGRLGTSTGISPKQSHIARENRP